MILPCLNKVAIKFNAIRQLVSIYRAVEEGGRRGAEPPLYNFKGG